MKVQLIRSATLRLLVADRRYLIDPWLARKSEGRSYAGRGRSPLVPLPLPLDEIVGGIDAVIVSHLHSDHFDEAARAALPGDIRIFSSARDAAAIAAQGFENVAPIGSELRDGNVVIGLASGRHGPPEVLAEMGDVSGFVFRAEGEPVLYWAGDTILCEEVRETIAAVEPDVIVVHACGASWNGIGPLVMDEAMVAEVLRIAPRASVIATHLDAVDHATVSRSALRRHFEAHPELAARLHIPADGETLEFA
ncbi:MBL fold metallo-hydrolase [Chelativorans salis]|uniref:MBL fold metallo-hydrolase n=1 Tax=Chelativorans salis TaxID=2978478 RepID=A0ABT2LP16_9HYPH|nr:MBL fold metallo-hydrolase [Chelativorans sp. EGI FJ00035]MCT7376305.1 MBL fold metallo-hydrolase [Chelativorans sp. EGI FJ00035]